MQFVGQNRLKARLQAYTLDTLPKTMMFIGESGCGKKTIVKELAYKLGLDIQFITKDVSGEELSAYMYSPINTMYIIDMAGIVDKQQNQFLKFIEEPTSTMWVSVITDTEVGILPTILNRCVKMYFESYSPSELKDCAWMLDNPSEFMLHVCKTPGQIANVSEKSMAELEKICKLLTTMPRNNSVNFANLLKVAAKINYKEEYDKFDFNIFLNALEYEAFDTFLKTNDLFSLRVYEIVNKYKQFLVGRNVAKEHLITHMLTDIWKEVEKCRQQN